ncbi:hypothetical protein BDM02DRAFT_3192050 [Thelephora ganbajun]|uniref:Uncharacterized protein n=1 Tax=Thelephora ganbajun TaxID=370292 RepID=A0ACB6Z1D1_THEGA|nr:hypothetical protein BDM02DRAFT_3192050 [Thelephora ganbajun]
MSPGDRHIFTPSISQAWKSALDAVSETDVSDFTSFLPNPAMFISVKSLDRLRKYVASWLRVRRAWLTKIHGMNHAPSCSTTRRWKTFFMAFYLTKDVPREKNTQTRTDKERKVTADFLGLSNIQAINVSCVHLEWEGEILEGSLDSAISCRIIHDVIWELHQLNFRFELRSLVHRLSPEISLTELEALVCSCFPEGPRNILDCENLGLGSCKQKDRGPWEAALTKVLNTIQPSTPILAEGGKRASDVRSTAAEKDIAMATEDVHGADKTAFPLSTGHMSAHQDILSMIQQGISTASDNTAENPMSVGRIMDWVEAHCDAIKACEEEEEEEEQKEKEKDFQSPQGGPKPPS